MLGVALSRAAKAPLDKLMRDRIFAPLGMRHTAFHLPKGKAALLAPMAEEEDFGTGVFNVMADMESSKVSRCVLCMSQEKETPTILSIP